MALGPFESLENDELRQQLAKTMLTLTSREQLILLLRFGLDDFEEGMTLKEVGAILGVSRARVMQIQAKALRKMRLLPENRSLLGYLRRI